MGTRKEHTCITCPALGRDGEDNRPQPNTWDYRYTCDPCRAQLPGLLNQIPRLHTILDATPTQGHNEPVSGSTEARLGARIPVLDQELRPITTRRSNTLPPRPNDTDQIGHAPAARTLHEIASAWLPAWQEAHPWEHLPDITVPDLARWLADRTDWACNTLEHTLPDHAQQLADLARHLRWLNDGGTDKPEPIPFVLCKCDRYSLARYQGDIICTHNQCRVRMSADEYERWTKLNAEFAKQEQAA